MIELLLLLLDLMPTKFKHTFSWSFLRTEHILHLAVAIKPSIPETITIAITKTFKVISKEVHIFTFQQNVQYMTTTCKASLSSGSWFTVWSSLKDKIACSTKSFNISFEYTEPFITTTISFYLNTIGIIHEEIRVDQCINHNHTILK